MPHPTQRMRCHFLRWFHTYLFPWSDRYPPDTVGIRRVATRETGCGKVSRRVLQGLPTCCTSKTTRVIQACAHTPRPRSPLDRAAEQIHPFTSQSSQNALAKSMSGRLTFFWQNVNKIKANTCQ